jgi:hypothetical protein
MDSIKTHTYVELLFKANSLSIWQIFNKIKGNEIIFWLLSSVCSVIRLD